MKDGAQAHTMQAYSSLVYLETEAGIHPQRLEFRLLLLGGLRSFVAADDVLQDSRQLKHGMNETVS